LDTAEAANANVDVVLARFVVDGFQTKGVLLMQVRTGS
jgi:hypothetical protein